MKLIVSTLLENKNKINELIEGFSNAEGQDFCKNNVLDLLHKVSFYTENFFINEEIFLKNYKLPSCAEHIEQHQLFVKKMLYFQDKLENFKPEICTELIDYLKEWYKTHVLKNDNEIIEFIEKSK
jgi:hemerythrin-like metal-binding protein